MPELNPVLRHYLSVEVRDGWLSMSAESKASKGRFTGYVKPVTRDLDIDEKAPLEAVKGFFVKLLADLFENKPKDQLASKIEFSGLFQDPMSTSGQRYRVSFATPSCAPSIRDSKDLWHPRRWRQSAIAPTIVFVEEAEEPLDDFGRY